MTSETANTLFIFCHLPATQEVLAQAIHHNNIGQSPCSQKGKRRKYELYIVVKYVSKVKHTNKAASDVFIKLNSFWHVFEVIIKVNFCFWHLLVGQMEYSQF